METFAKGLLLVLFGIPGFAALLAAMMIARGYVASLLWAWFIVPGFGAQPISIPLAIGISLTLGMWTTHRTWQEMDDPKKKWYPLTSILIGPPFVLLCGWIVKQYL